MSQHRRAKIVWLFDVAMEVIESAVAKRRPLTKREARVVRAALDGLERA